MQSLYEDRPAAGPSPAPGARADDPRQTLLDALMPVYAFGHRHAIHVEAPAAAVAAAAERYRIDSAPVVRLLFRLRGLGPAPMTLRSMLDGGGFALLAERPGQEIVVGTAGRFWALDERAALVRPHDAATFVAFREPGCAKAVLAFRIDALADGTTRLATETRVACVDTAAWLRFAPYWLVIKPFSAFMRTVILRGIATAARAAEPA